MLYAPVNVIESQAIDCCVFSSALFEGQTGLGHKFEGENEIVAVKLCASEIIVMFSVCEGREMSVHVSKQVSGVVPPAVIGPLTTPAVAWPSI